MFVETRAVPESGHLPRVDTTLTRLLRDYPNVAKIITSDMQVRITELEADVDRVLDEESKRIKQELAESQTELERMRVENEGLRHLEQRLEQLYNALDK